MNACVRCSGRASSSLTFSYASRESWLHDLGAGSQHRGYALCESHADGVTPPVGWVLHDRRARLRSLFRGLETG